MTYSSAQVLDRSGITYRQLDHWVRTGKLACANPGTGAGSSREFSQSQMQTAVNAGALIRLGFIPMKALEIGRFLAAKIDRLNLVDQSTQTVVRITLASPVVVDDDPVDAASPETWVPTDAEVAEHPNGVGEGVGVLCATCGKPRRNHDDDACTWRDTTLDGHGHRRISPYSTACEHIGCHARYQAHEIWTV